MFQTLSLSPEESARVAQLMESDRQRLTGITGKFKQNTAGNWNVWCDICDQRILKRYMRREDAEHAVKQHKTLTHRETAQ